MRTNRRAMVGVLAGALLFATLVAPPAAAADGSSSGNHGTNGETDVSVCPSAVPAGQASCLGRRRTDSAATTQRPARPGVLRSSATIGNSGAYDPSYLQSAYVSPSATNGAGQTVAIVDAYGDPSAEADLASYRSFFGLSACTTGNGCFRKVDEYGGTKYPSGNTGWGQETALDLDMVSAMCPQCHILLVEASSAYISDLGAAVNEAVALRANVVSNSYGGPEYPGEANDSNSYYSHPGVAVTVAAGDGGYGTEFPAASNTVTAVGGTSLQQATNTGTRNNATETVWSGTGSGCSSAYAPIKPAWQKDTGCANRTISDVSAVADPSTGVWVYDTYGGGSWAVFGGTSVATPIVGAVYALAGNAPGSPTPMNSLPYAHTGTGALNDVTSGSNGSCSGTYLCTGTQGYDGPTGLGTPNGVAAFSAVVGTPTAPQGLTATPGDGKVSLSWLAPASNGGSAITGYTVTAVDSTTPANGTQTCTWTTGALSCTVMGLTNGDAYTFTVKAVNAVGEGPQSSVASATPATTPGAPQNLIAQTATSRGVTLTWGPTSNGGPAITSYRLNRSTRSGRETFYVTVTSCTTSICSYTDTGTSRGTTYYYNVAATNRVGTGSVSNQASARAK